MPDILHRLKIRVPPELVYRALTTAEGIRSWWTRDANLDAKIGGVGEFRFYNGSGLTKVAVEELVPAARVVWRTVSANAPGGWDGTTITFDLQPEGESTVLAFAHRGFREANEGYAAVTTGWAYYLVSLQQYLERGTGAPHPDVDFARVIG